MSSKTKRANLKYGICLGVLLSAFLLLRMLFGIPAERPVELKDIISQFVVLISFTYVIKRKSEPSQFGFWKAYWTSYSMVLVSAVIYGLFLYIYIIGIDEGMQQRCLEVQMSSGVNQGLTEADLQYSIRPSYIAFTSMLINAAVGLITSAIAALLFADRRKKTTKQA